MPAEMSGNRFEIPQPRSIHQVTLGDGTVAAVRRHGDPEGPRIVLSHGSGLAIDLYYPFWSLLVDEFDLFIYDLRNHGWNEIGPRDKHNVPTLIDDLHRILNEIGRYAGRKRVTGVFHSLSSLIAIQSFSDIFRASSVAPIDELSGLVLFDPPLCKPGLSEQEFDVIVERAVAQATLRASRFKTIEECVELLQWTRLLKRVPPGTAELFARATLRKAQDGNGYELRCPPIYEAQITEFVRGYSVLPDFGSFPCPVKVIGADPTVQYSFLPTVNLLDVVAVDYDFVPETTHLLQVEKPHECAALVRDFMAAHGLR